MRKLLLSLTVLAGVAAAAPGAQAASRVAGPLPVVDAPAAVQSVQYYRDGWRYRHWRRQEWRRHYWRRHYRRW